MTRVPRLRIRRVNSAPVRAQADYILYWMTANRRVDWNFSLDRAVELAREHDLPLVVFEPLRAGYRWASRRFHQFVIDGMKVNRERLDETGVTYFPYVETVVGEATGLLSALADHAAVVVTDDWPCFFFPNMLASAAQGLSVRLEAVDSNGLLPMWATERTFSRAVDLRRFLQKNLLQHLLERPEPSPLLDSSGLAGARLPKTVLSRYPVSDLVPALSTLAIDQSVCEGHLEGGAAAGSQVLDRFLRCRLERYGEGRNQPEDPVTSGLSPYLHFGHVSVHQAFYLLSQQEEWNPSQVAEFTSGKREGWWGMSPNAESFLDELVTWRELGFNFCSHRSDYDHYESLPQWAQTTLLVHAHDERPHLYDLSTFENAATHDDLWNAAQNELRETGVMHNYLRMLWGKKILHWSASPREALAIMIELNNKYALDGRDPNSYSGIFWVLGRFDRAWGPERSIFGKVRYMTSANTRRKLRVKAYIERWSGREGTPRRLF